MPGSSEYLLGSIVSYTNMAKQKLLNVQADTLAKYGAVSRETACEMALGVRKQLGSDYGVSITGNAGLIFILQSRLKNLCCWHRQRKGNVNGII